MVRLCDCCKFHYYESSKKTHFNTTQLNAVVILFKNQSYICFNRFFKNYFFTATMLLSQVYYYESSKNTCLEIKQIQWKSQMTSQNNAVMHNCTEYNKQYGPVINGVYGPPTYFKTMRIKFIHPESTLL